MIGMYVLGIETKYTTHLNKRTNLKLNTISNRLYVYHHV